MKEDPTDKTGSLFVTVCYVGLLGALVGIGAWQHRKELRALRLINNPNSINNC